MGQELRKEGVSINPVLLPPCSSYNQFKLHFCLLNPLFPPTFPKTFITRILFAWVKITHIKGFEKWKPLKTITVDVIED